MYSNKPTVNILTSLLIEKEIRKAVVCPGSRNIPLVHNFTECPLIECFSVTDERSAAFYALGLSLAADEPVAVCVTSGSAVLNTAPAVAEAFYRHVPLVVISADRPEEWIGRQDGQTLPQDGILERITKQSTDIPDFNDDDETGLNFASLSMNIALNECVNGEQGPVHINMRLKEPLFDFTVDSLPTGRDIAPVRWFAGTGASQQADQVITDFIEAEKKLIVIGQITHRDAEFDNIIKRLRNHYLILCEPLATSYAEPFDSVLPFMAEKLADTQIDALVSLGGNFVSKRIKQTLRRLDVKSHYEITPSGKAHDTFMHQTCVVAANEKNFLLALLERTRDRHTVKDFMKETFSPVVQVSSNVIDTCTPPYSQLFAVKELELSLEDMDYESEVHYANSTAVRLGTLCARRRYIWCNRGVNGIEGSLSTAAGFSLATEAMTFCIIGDLSFFYDQNALWNASLRGNLRIMLLNNGGGGIFYGLDGLDATHPSMDSITGCHSASARGVCELYDIGYLSAGNEEEYRNALVRFLTEETTRPVVMEVFTDTDTDMKVVSDLNRLISSAAETETDV